MQKKPEGMDMQKTPEGIGMQQNRVSDENSVSMSTREDHKYEHRTRSQR
jgi:hypothetical protein